MHLQAVVSHLRRRDFRTRVCKDLRERGLLGLADLLNDFSCPGFAKWRWTTLGDCCEKLQTVWGSFRMHFNADLVKNAKDKTNTERLLFAIEDELFSIHFKLVSFVADWLCQISNWIGGCSCHEEELLRQ